jgi:hypothetical protein
MEQLPHLFGERVTVTDLLQGGRARITPILEQKEIFGGSSEDPSSGAGQFRRLALHV